MGCVATLPRTWLPLHVDAVPRGAIPGGAGAVRALASDRRLADEQRVRTLNLHGTREFEHDFDARHPRWGIAAGSLRAENPRGIG